MLRSTSTCHAEASLFAYDATRGYDEAWTWSLTNPRMLNLSALDFLEMRDPHDLPRVAREARQLRRDVIASLGPWWPRSLKGWVPWLGANASVLSVTQCGSM